MNEQLRDFIIGMLIMSFLTAFYILTAVFNQI